MDSPIIISRRILDQLDFAGLFPLSDYDMIDDVLLPYVVAEESEPDGLQLVVIVVIQHGSNYLVAEDAGKYSMGFVRECRAYGNVKPYSICNIAVPTAQMLIEYYALGIKYTMSALGLMQCDQPAGGRQWLGCLFLAEISYDIDDRMLGTKKVSMMSIGEIHKHLGAEWELDIATLARTCAGIS